MFGRPYFRSRTAYILALSTLFVLAISVYLPGMHGPWLFDDYANLVNNSFLRIQDLSPKTLLHASWALDSGPLHRPVAMLSFALNYYFAGSFDHTLPFKLTNVLIHAINGILVFWLVRLLLEGRAVITRSRTRKRQPESRNEFWAALMVALLWVAHPIQISSVLYIVQRMTELAALFMFLSLICYFLARQRIAAQRSLAWSTHLLMVASVGFWLLGLLSKENAAITPVIVLMLELVFFPKEKPWRYWSKLTPQIKAGIIACCSLLALGALYFVIQYALPGYANRPFTMLERLLTESRVLFFYLSLLLVPQINQFTLYHDDVLLSTSLIDPWTTLPAILGHVALISLACILLVRRKLPIVGLGILWFYTAHAIESSIIPLELVHEHRNYFPSLGIFLAIVELVRIGARRLNFPRLVWCLPLFLFFFTGVTATRAYQWSSANKFYAYELVHHPHSAMANAGLAGVLTKMGRPNEAEQALRLAMELQPTEPSLMIWLLTVQIQQGKPLDASVQQKIIDLLAHAPLTATTIKTLGDVANCLGNWCGSLSQPMQEWLDTLIERQHNAGDKSYYYYLLGISLVNQGKTGDAIAAFWKSHELDPRYPHPLFNLASIYLQLKDIKNAERILALLQKPIYNGPQGMAQQLDTIAAAVEQLKNSEQRTNP